MESNTNYDDTDQYEVMNQYRIRADLGRDKPASLPCSGNANFYESKSQERIKHELAKARTAKFSSENTQNCEMENLGEIDLEMDKDKTASALDENNNNYDRVN